MGRANSECKGEAKEMVHSKQTKMMQDTVVQRQNVEAGANQIGKVNLESHMERILAVIQDSKTVLEQKIEITVTDVGLQQ
ncbi:hypothetical protein NDU88_006047 [Pleurodeles waltl]|uniref:Uncharacterized protein n=1 Tax=Pleurodeles waltl TaxID=8319 RepID=A0AAV7LN07_PLEWA|nr:hypothetical protein NDU88_006047 [Pleurodeles waltl]